jgi:hypothetical protein
MAAGLRIAAAGPSPLSVVRSGRIANDLGATPTARSAAQDQGCLEYLMMPPTYNDRPAKHSAENVTLTVRTDGWPQRRTKYPRTGQEGAQTCLPRGRKFAGRYKGSKRENQTTPLRWFGKSRYNTPGKNTTPHVVCFER